MFLTIGLPTYDDFDGVYFTLQALKAYHDLQDVELLVIDTKPQSCNDTKNACLAVGGSYYHRPDCQGTAPAKNAVFELAKGKFVMCIDCHVLLVKDSVKKLKEYLKKNENTKNIFHGPLLYDDQRNISTHFDPQWRGQMYGTWGNDPRVATQEDFEIPMQGGGLFVCRKDAWPKFHKGFRGFGSEEGYIQEKIRQNGGKAICISWLKWIHRFSRPKGVPYPLALKDRVINYLIGWSELGMNYGEVINWFKDKITQQELSECIKEFSKYTGFSISASPAKEISVPKIFYVLDSVNSKTFTELNTLHSKYVFENKSFVDAMKDFVNREENYCIVLKENEILNEQEMKKVDEWIVIKQQTLKIAALRETETKTLKRKNDIFSYRIADDIDIDESKSLVISKDFAKLFLREDNKIKLSELAHKNNIKPFVLFNPNMIYKINPHITHLDNVSGGLEFCDIREIVWNSKDKWCLDITALTLQSTLSLCQKGAGIVRVFDFQNQDKETLKKELDVFGFANFVIADISEEIVAPDEGERVLLVNHENLPEYLKDFAYTQHETFLRPKDVVIVLHAEEEIRDVYKNSKHFKIEFISERCLIATKT